MGRSGLEIDRGAGGVKKVGHSIGAAGTAAQLVVPGKSGERLVAAGSGHDVVPRRSDGELDVREGVRAVAGRGPLTHAGKRQFDSQVRCRAVTDEIASKATGHGVVAGRQVEAL